MAFDLTLPSMAQADWATALGSVRANLLAMVSGDSGVFSKKWITADPADLVLEKSGTTAKARLTSSVASGVEDLWLASNASQSVGGATWNRDDTAKVAWRVGVPAGTFDLFMVDRAAAAANPITWANLFKIDGSGNATAIANGGNVEVAVQGANSASAMVRWRNPSGTLHWTIYESFGSAGQQGSLTISDNVAAADRFKIDTSGNVGIGGTPNVKLEVVGTATAEAFRLTGLMKFAGTNSTGAGSAALGANCPAVTATAPYTWIKAISSDGSTVYIPCWK
jgi:hypothetical protein